MHLPAEPVPIMAGSVRIEQVAANLMLNALDAVEGTEDARISVTLTAADGQARLEVRDNGAGIAEVDLSRVTEPFFTTKLTGERLGLGLAICKAILADFGGTLDILSAPQQGTVVIATLPLAEDESRAA